MFDLQEITSCRSESCILNICFKLVHGFLQCGKSCSNAVTSLETKQRQAPQRRAETAVSLRRNVSESRDVGTGGDNHTFSRGDLTLGCLSICLSFTLLRLQDDGPSLHPVQSSLSNQTQLTIDISAYQTAWQLHQHPARPRRHPHTHTHTHTHDPDCPFTGLDL